MSDEEKDYIKYKLALLGDTLVGKSSIFKKISKNEFYEHIIATIGSDKKTLNFDNIEVNLNGTKVKRSFQISLYDTAGQEKYRSIAGNYFKNSDGIIIIYDITNQKSFENIEIWLESIKEILSDWNDQNYLIMLLGNKLDLVNDKRKNREVQVEDGKNKCNDIGMVWGGECSAKEFTDKQLIDIIEMFVKQIFERTKLKSPNNSSILSKPNQTKKKCCK
jgi:small GTP-binding protein